MPTWTRDDGSCALCESTVHCGIHHGPVKPKRTRRTKKPRTIGASEIASILGVDPYCTPQERYLQFRGEAPRDAENEHMLRGKALEGGLAKWWKALSGADSLKTQVKLLHPNGWARATPDGLATVGGELVVLETKCPAGYRSWDDRAGKYPFQYHVQVVWQLGVAQACGLEVKRAELAAGPIFGRLLRFSIQPDPEFFALAMTRAETFLKCVETGEPLPSAFHEAAQEASP